MNLLKSFISISFFTLISKIFGFFRDIIIARFFGAGIETDSFFIAFKFPNFLRNIFAEGAFSHSCIPILMEYKTKKKNTEIKEFISYVSGLLIFILMIISLFGIIFASNIIYILLPGFIKQKDKFILTVDLFKIVFPYILLISLATLYNLILNTWNNFLVSSCTPLLFNLVIILSILILSQYCSPSIFALAIGVIIGGLVQILYQIPFLKKINKFIIPKISISNSSIVKLVRSMKSGIIIICIGQINVIFNIFLSSFLSSGSISWIYYADRLIELPIGILAVALSTVLFPNFSKSFLTGNKKEFQKLLDWGLRICFLFAFPFGIIMSLLAKPLIFSFFQYKNFTNHDAIMTEKVLIFYSIGLLGFMINKIFIPVFYSIKEIKTLTIITILSCFFTQIMNLIFIKFFYHSGLALSSSLNAYFYSFMLYFQLKKKNIFFPLPGWNKFILKLGIALAIMITTLTILLHFFPFVVESSMIIRIMQLIFFIFMGSFSYYLMLFFLGFKLNSIFLKN
ncbi:MAG: murein biosynthesis integral membrane protein MurJ [Arsenophonus sp.]|nr:MAG: murein biosynthesis integral membrane protein MurJ [Arsenophonus sp.]